MDFHAHSKAGQVLVERAAELSEHAAVAELNSRIWMRVRARSIKGVKVNNKMSHNNFSCRFCNNDTEESQEHLEVCGGCDFERRRLNMTNWKGQVIFWRRMSAKLSAGG